MNPLKEVPTAIAAGVLARAQHPLLGAFLISWSIFNWQVFIHLVSLSESVSEKIATIQALVSFPSSHLIPLAFAIAYVLASPWLLLLIQWYMDLADERSRKRERRREEEDFRYRMDIADREVKLLHAQRVRLQGSEQLDRVREQINSFYEELASDLQRRSEALAERILTATAKIEGEKISPLERKMQGISEHMRQSEVELSELLNRVQREVRYYREEMTDLIHAVRLRRTSGVNEEQAREDETSEDIETNAAPYPLHEGAISNNLNQIEHPSIDEIRLLGLTDDEIPAYLRKFVSGRKSDQS